MPHITKVKRPKHSTEVVQVTTGLCLTPDVTVKHISCINSFKVRSLDGMKGVICEEVLIKYNVSEHSDLMQTV